MNRNLLFSKLDVISNIFLYSTCSIIFFILFTQEQNFFVRLFDLFILGFSFNQFLENLEKYNK